MATQASLRASINSARPDAASIARQSAVTSKYRRKPEKRRSMPQELETSGGSVVCAEPA